MTHSCRNDTVGTCQKEHFRVDHLQHVCIINTEITHLLLPLCVRNEHCNNSPSFLSEGAFQSLAYVINTVLSNKHCNNTPTTTTICRNDTVGTCQKEHLSLRK